MNGKWITKRLVILVMLLFMFTTSTTQTYADEKSPDAQVFAPEDLKISPFAFVYGDLSNLDDTDDPYYSIQKLQDLPYLVCAPPSELSENSKQVTEAIKLKTKLFGYVNLGPNNPESPQDSWRYANLTKIKTEIDQLVESNWYGVFIDQFGYDYHETRQRQNEIIDYAHQKGLKCFVNAWFPDDALGSIFNAVSNPTSEPTHLNSGDYYLIESFLMSDSFYRGDSSYLDKFLKIKNYHEDLGINIVVLSYKREATSWNQASDDIQLSYILAQCLGYQGWWFGGWNGRADYWYLNPSVDLGQLVQPLHVITGTRYVAQTEHYRIEYYADKLPHLIAYPKKINQPVITIRHQIPTDYIDTNQLTTQEAQSLQKRLNDYGFTDSQSHSLQENGIFGASSKNALLRFLDANHYDYYSTDARVLLFSSQAINGLNGTGELKLFDKLSAILDETILYMEEGIAYFLRSMANLIEPYYEKMKAQFDSSLGISL